MIPNFNFSVKSQYLWPHTSDHLSQVTKFPEILGGHLQAVRLINQWNIN